MNILLCKYDLVDTTAELFCELSEKVYLILDDFDSRRELNNNVLSKMEHVYRISSFDSIEELAAIAIDLESKNIRIDKIASFTEFSQFGAGYLCDILGLSCYSSMLALNTRDKRRMKLLAKESGLACAKYLSFPDAKEIDIGLVDDEIGFPAVVKPIGGMGTTSIKIIANSNNLSEFKLSYKKRPEIRSPHLIVEEFIDGE